jgi:hypothetical protein
MRVFSRNGLTHSTLVCLVVASLVTGCSDEPTANNSVGTQLIPGNVLSRTITLGAVGGASFIHSTAMDGRTNLVGQSQRLGYKAYTMLRFLYMPNRDSVQVLSAKLELRGVSWFGDSIGQLGLDAYVINRNWGQTTLTADSLTNLWSTSSSALAATYLGTVTSDTEWVSLNLSPSVVRNWLDDTLSASNYGIVLVPTAQCNVVRGFNAFDYDSVSFYPKLTVIARGNLTNLPDTTVYQTYGQDTFVGISANFVADPTRLFTQSGLAYRSLLRFDCSSIPRGATINRAMLTLSFDPTNNELNRFTGDTAIVAHRVASTTDSTVFEAYSTRGSSSLRDSSTLAIDIRHHVQTWIRDASQNSGVLLRMVDASEYSSAGRFAFFNYNAADTTKRPRLVVTYSVLAKQEGQ